MGLEFTCTGVYFYKLFSVSAWKPKTFYEPLSNTIHSTMFMHEKWSNRRMSQLTRKRGGGGVGEPKLGREPTTTKKINFCIIKDVKPLYMLFLSRKPEAPHYMNKNILLETEVLSVRFFRHKIY